MTINENFNTKLHAKDLVKRYAQTHFGKVEQLQLHVLTKSKRGGGRREKKIIETKKSYRITIMYKCNKTI